MIALVPWESFASASLPHQPAHSTVRLGLGATTETRFVSTTEMDMQMHPAGYWGPVTATLDWCEVRHYSSTHLISPFHHVFQANYQFSHYVAEISNTFSNLFFVCISVYGARLSSRESLPTRYLVGYAVRLFARFFFFKLQHFVLPPFADYYFLRYL